MTTKQEQLTQLFLKRRTAYNNTSASILKHLEAGVLAGISSYFTERNEIGEGKTLEWDEVGYVEQYNMLILVGTINYAVGTRVTTEDGEVVVVTEDLAPYFHRIIRVGLPFNMVDATVEEVKLFLDKRDEDTEQEQTEAAKFLRELLAVADEDDQTEPSEFNFDTLSEEQLKRLVVPKKGTVN